MGGVKADREPRAPNSSRHWVVALLMACGARDALPGADGYASTSGAGGPVLLEDCEPSDVRLCGGPTCPPADLTECPGVGCTAVSHRNTGERLEPLAVSDGCPSGLCGPGCECNEGDVCVGRSADKPFGLCVFVASDRTCLPADRSECPDACAVFRVGPEDQGYADAHGLCTFDEACAAAEARGFVTCYPGQP